MTDDTPTETDTDSERTDQPADTATESDTLGDPTPERSHTDDVPHDETVVDLSADQPPTDSEGDADATHAPDPRTTEADRGRDVGPTTDRDDTRAADAQTAESEHETTTARGETEREREYERERERVAATETAQRKAAPPKEGGQDYDAAAEAKRLVNNVEGDTPAERATNAVAQVRSHLKELSNRLTQLRQRESQLESRLNDLRDSKVHVMYAPTDQTVMRSFGGVTTSVPPAGAYESDHDDRVPDVDTAALTDDEQQRIDWQGVYDRDDLLRDIAETLDTEQNTLASVQEEQGKMERGIGQAEAILTELQDFAEKSSWMADDAAATSTETTTDQQYSTGQPQQSRARSPSDRRGHARGGSGPSQERREALEQRRDQLEQFAEERDGRLGEGTRPQPRDPTTEYDEHLRE